MIHLAGVDTWSIPRDFYHEERSTFWTQRLTNIKDESASSWFTRITKANCADTEQTFHDIMKKKNLSFEWIETNNRHRYFFFKNLESFIDLTKIVFTRNPNAGTTVTDNNYLLTTLPVPRYCPLCFERDKIPYYRQIWQILFVTLCPVHNVLLFATCPTCKAPIEYWKTTWKQPICSCFSCHEDFRNNYRFLLYPRKDEISRFQDDLLQIYFHSSYNDKIINEWTFFKNLGRVALLLIPESNEFLTNLKNTIWRKPRGGIYIEPERMHNALRFAFTIFLKNPGPFIKSDLSTAQLIKIDLEAKRYQFHED